MHNFDITFPKRVTYQIKPELKQVAVQRFKRLWAAVLTLLLIIPFYTYQPNVSKADGPTNVYYSVGQNTTDHKTGSPTLTISSGLGTFSIPQTATNMGVGDKVTFNTSTVCYISGKTSTSVWTLITATGTTCGDVTDATVNSIGHAFSSLNAAVGSSAGNASTSNFLNTTNLVTGNYVLNVPVYYDSGADTTAVSTNSWTTGADNYIRIYTPTNTSAEVNQSQRHNGKWDDAKYSLVVQNGITFSISGSGVGYVRIDGLQMANENNTANSSHVLNYNGPTNTNDIRISNSILRRAGGSSFSGRVFSSASGNRVALTMWNTLLYGLQDSSISNNESIYLYGSDTTPSNIYNVTISGGVSGIRTLSGTIYLKNVIINNAKLDFQNSGATLHVNYSASDDATADDFDSDGVSGNNRINQTFSFVDSANGDFHLQTGDTAAKDRGMSDPGSGLFSDDIDREARTGTWDIGADEEQATDTTSPTITEVTPVTSPTRDLTPSYTFNSTEAGTITYGGSCSSSTTAASSGNNTVTFSELADGTYSNCTIKVTDGSSNQSNTLNLSLFTINSTLPYYVDNADPGASDSNTGDENSPFLTIQKCVTVVVPGGDCIVKSGIYTGNISTTTDGTSIDRITITAASSSNTIITGSMTINNAYYTVSGFKFQGEKLLLKYDGSHHNMIDSNEFTGGEEGISMSMNETANGTNGPAHNTISNNEFHEMTGNAMINLSGHDNLITSNIFRDNDGWDVFRISGANQTIKANQFLRIVPMEDTNINHADIMQTFDTQDDDISKGIIFEDNLIKDGLSQIGNIENGGPADISDWTIRNNIFVNSRIQLNISIPSVKVYNNTVYNVPSTYSACAYGFRFFVNGDESATNGEVYNNIFIGDGAFYCISTGLGVADYNILANLDGSAKTAPNEGPHGINGGVTAADIFVDPDNNDFHLKAGSPAIDAGTTISTFSNDYEGTTRPQLSSWDIGAYEYAPDPDEEDNDPSPTPPPPVPTPPTSIRSLTPIQTVQEPSNDPPFLPPSPNQNNPPSIPDPFLNYLRYGMTSLEVKKLQIFLNEDQDTRLGNDGPGSPGKETSFFGPKTLNAVKRFQEKYLQDVLSPWNLTKGTGYAGKTTLEKINRLIRGE